MRNILIFGIVSTCNRVFKDKLVSSTTELLQFQFLRTVVFVHFFCTERLLIDLMCNLRGYTMSLYKGEEIVEVVEGRETIICTMDLWVEWNWILWISMNRSACSFYLVLRVWLLLLRHWSMDCLHGSEQPLFGWILAEVFLVCHCRRISFVLRFVWMGWS